MTHLCVSKLTSIASDNGLSPGQHQAIIWNNAGILLIGPLGTNFREILIEIQTSSLTKKHLKMSSAKCRSFCLGLNVLNKTTVDTSSKIPQTNTQISFYLMHTRRDASTVLEWSYDNLCASNLALDGTIKMDQYQPTSTVSISVTPQEK